MCANTQSTPRERWVEGWTSRQKGNDEDDIHKTQEWINFVPIFLILMSQLFVFFDSDVSALSWCGGASWGNEELTNGCNGHFLYWFLMIASI